ncbi:hypothetical protein HZC07_04095, partial [Candidatus Micrarchaeota archaeon]|nr:hypothetical protein [Candidatus Micrarchaeota archaeon]
MHELFTALNAAVFSVARDAGAFGFTPHPVSSAPPLTDPVTNLTALPNGHAKYSYIVLSGL